MPKPPPLAPWDMAEGESAKAYEAFARYRDAGAGRTVERVAAECSKSVSLLLRWSAAHGWQERVRAFDAEAARRASAKSLDTHAEALARQASLGRLMQARGGERYAKMDPMELAPAEATRAIVEGAKVERDALGIGASLSLATDGDPKIIHVTIDLSGATPRMRRDDDDGD